MTAVNYLWDPDESNIVRELDDSGAVIAQYTTEPSLYGDLLSQRRNGQDSYYHYDGQGSTLALTNSNGDVTDTYGYSSFGELTIRTGSTVNPFRYIGQKGYYRDVETGECNVRRRTLSISCGRWFSVDPKRFVDSFNIYLYVINNAVNEFDPSGNATQCSARCLRPSGAGVVDGGARGGKVEASLSNTVPKFDGVNVRGIKSAFGALYFIAATVKPTSFWYEPKTKAQPNTLADCCCCCTQVNWAQVLKFSVTGSAKALAVLPPRPPNGVPYIDSQLPIGTGFNPCEAPSPVLPEGDSWSLQDGPGQEGIQKFFALGGKTFTTQFESCAYCTNGPETFLSPFPYMVTYCCLTWGYSVYEMGGKIKVGRWINDKTKTWDYTGDDTAAEAGKRKINGEFSCSPPSADFSSAILDLRVWIRPKK